MKTPHEACDCAECQDIRRYSTWPPSQGAYLNTTTTQQEEGLDFNQGASRDKKTED